MKTTTITVQELLLDAQKANILETLSYIYVDKDAMRTLLKPYHMQGKLGFAGHILLIFSQNTACECLLETRTVGKSDYSPALLV